MSIVPPTGILRLVWEQAVYEGEDKSEAFWQVFLHFAFGELDEYAVTSEPPPEPLPWRLDTVVRRYNADFDIVSILVRVECPQPDRNLGEVEKQALDAANMYMDLYHLSHAYVVTTRELTFRTWIVREGDHTLRPLYGMAVRGDESQYIAVNSPDAYRLTDAIQIMKEVEKTIN
ncbi:MAG: hypothetical protein M1818_003597 [Claussenomyces sp. TS43310]|nr:MAG: hypothetical protein M1818_003597 [Claussenomyces sp. TS43310]